MPVYFQQVQPEWRVKDQYYLQSVQASLGYDSMSGNTDAMSTYKVKPAEINRLFNYVNYSKGIYLGFWFSVVFHAYK